VFDYLTHTLYYTHNGDASTQNSIFGVDFVLDDVKKKISLLLYWVYFFKIPNSAGNFRVLTRWSD